MWDETHYYKLTLLDGKYRVEENIYKFLNKMDDLAYNEREKQKRLIALTDEKYNRTHFETIRLIFEIYDEIFNNIRICCTDFKIICDDEDYEYVLYPTLGEVEEAVIKAIEEWCD